MQPRGGKARRVNGSSDAPNGMSPASPPASEGASAASSEAATASGGGAKRRRRRKKKNKNQGSPIPGSAAAANAQKANQNKNKGEENKTSKDYYFDSYSHFGIHEEMLKDSVRTNAYMDAFLKNKHLIRGKTVLDIGCGTGILCMFAAKAGAKQVIGIECAGIIDHARQIVKENGFADKITLIKGKVEEITLPVDKVDIIVSEWMGYFLLYESMLDTVLYARDKWLRKGGMILPDKARLFFVGIEDAQYFEEKINFWDNVYGFSMSCIKEQAMLEPLVDRCNGEQVVTNAACVLEVDINTVKKEDLDFRAQFELKLERDEYVHALVAYFDVIFSHTHTRLTLPTGPYDAYTHWQQTVFYLSEAVIGLQNESIQGTVDVRRNAHNPRDLDIELTTTLKMHTQDKERAYSDKRKYRMR